MDFRRLLAAGELLHRVGDAEPQTQADLQLALSHIPLAERELLLITAAGFEPRHAALVLGISYTALRQRLVRARAHLAQAIKELDV